MKQMTRRRLLKQIPSKVYPQIQNDFWTSIEDPNIGFEISRAFIQARIKAGLTQEELANRLRTTQSVIIRLESGQCLPSTDTINRFAQATGTFICIKLDN